MTPEAKAREIAERHRWPWDAVPQPYKSALLEALHFQPLPEWSETMDSKCFCRTLDPTRQPCLVCVQNRRKPTPTKPDELPEDVLREACEELGGAESRWTLANCRYNPAVRTVARLLVRIKELEGPKEDPDLVLAREMAAQEAAAREWHQTVENIRAKNADKHELVQSALRTIKHLRDAGWKEGV